jgi:hypothetical protein
VTVGGHPLPAHVRTIEVEATAGQGPAGARLLRVHGRLVDRHPHGVPAAAGIAHDGDRIHDVEVVLTVGYPDFVVVAVEGRMRTVPYPTICPDALPPLDSLVGLSVTRGFTRALNERLGRERGCTHVVVRQGAGAAFGFGSTEAADPGTGPWFVNSCQAWREDGPLHQRWLAEHRGPPTPSADEPAASRMPPGEPA